MKRRQLMKLSFAGAASAVMAPILSGTAGQPGRPGGPPVPDARSTAPLPVPSSGEIPVAVLLATDAEVVDFTGPWGVFEYVLPPGAQHSPFKLYTVAESKAPLTVSGGLTVVPDFAFADAPRPKVIVVPAMDVDKAPVAMLDWLKSVQSAADVTMSVCNGSFVLAKAGLLDRRSATAHHGGYGMLHAMFPEVTLIRGVRYVEDGKVATAGGLTSGTDLALRVVERYFGRAVAQKTALDLEYQGTGWMHPESNMMFAKKPVPTKEHPVCPICEAELDRKTALKEDYRGATYYFCGEWCRSRFLAAPQRFK